METVRVDLPSELVEAAGIKAEALSMETSALMALDLYRQDKVSMGRAAELCGMPLEDFLHFASRHNVPMHYDLAELEEDRKTLARLGL